MHVTHTHALQAAWHSELIVYSSCFPCGRTPLTKTTTKSVTPQDCAGVCPYVHMCKGTHTRKEREAAGTLKSCLRVLWRAASVYLRLNGIISHSPASPPLLCRRTMWWKPCVCGGKGLKASHWGRAFCQGEGTEVKCSWRFSFFRQWFLKGKGGQSS